MPKPIEGESESDWMGRSVPVLIKEGKGQKQAVAICMNMYQGAVKSQDLKKVKAMKAELQKSIRKAQLDEYRTECPDDDDNIAEKYAHCRMDGMNTCEALICARKSPTPMMQKLQKVYEGLKRLNEKK